MCLFFDGSVVSCFLVFWTTLRSEFIRFWYIFQLVASSDVLIENYIPGKLDEMGLGYEELRRLNSRLIYVTITGRQNETKLIYALEYISAFSRIGAI